MRRFALSLLILGLFNPHLRAASFERYPVDISAYSRNPERAAELHQLRLALKVEGPDREKQLKRQLELTEELAERESDWVDMHWMAAEAAFQLGSIYQNPKDLAYARTVFVRGQKAVERCLARNKEHPICKLYLGAMIGKIASIDGIFSSLNKAKAVETLWLDVIASRYDYPLSDETSLQGATRYALGLFYRLVPDLTILKWVFDVKGDIEKSIQFHRDAVAIDGPNSCNKTMLGVALICASKNDKTDERRVEGLRHLAEAQRIEAPTSIARACANDIPDLIADPDRACGYEPSRQQDQDEKDIDLKK